MSPLALRAPAAGEAAAIAALLNRHAAALHGDADVTEAVVVEWIESADVEIAVGEVDGELVGYGDLTLAADGTRADLDVREHPAGGQAAPALLDELERRAARAGARVLRAFADAQEDAWRAELEARGYEPVRHFFRMVATVDGDVAEPVWPDGVVVRPFRDGEERAVHAAHGEAFSDHWGFELEPYERWLRNVVETERFHRSLCFVAAAGEEIAGICLCSAHLSGDPTLGWVRVLGVRPAWRRRGLGLALLLHAFRVFRQRGCSRVALGVDASSTTGALELYERAGMRSDRRNDVYERRLA